jgi:hypothetical protein
VNPAEWLRSVAHRADDDELAIEAAEALASFARQPGLVVACRRLLAHHPEHGVLWWVCSTMLTTTDPDAAASDIVRRLDTDRTADRLSAALPLLDADEVVLTGGWNRTVDRALESRPDLAVAAVRLSDDAARALRRRRAEQSVRLVDPWEIDLLRVGHVLVPAAAVGPGRALVACGTGDVLAMLPSSVEVWLVAGAGRVLPPVVIDAIVRETADPIARDPVLEITSLERFDRLAGAAGVQRPDDAASRFDCPVAVELLRPLD